MVTIRVCGVAPRVGAWIETNSRTSADYYGVSHPVWVRGLKPIAALSYDANLQSHPVWVRGLKLAYQKIYADYYRRTPCGCVD